MGLSACSQNDKRQEYIMHMYSFTIALSTNEATPISDVFVSVSEYSAA